MNCPESDEEPKDLQNNHHTVIVVLYNLLFNTLRHDSFYF